MRGKSFPVSSQAEATRHVCGAPGVYVVSSLLRTPLWAFQVMRNLWGWLKSSGAVDVARSQKTPFCD
jgi:hypothetical protein